MEIGLVQRINIDDEMQQAYLDYAMSVIVARAIPDARDGLKPVHRRILYAMYDMGLRPDTPYKKSARIVGEVLGKYHPHGDAAVYEAMARMAQDFSMRYPLVDGQGNFGSVDGDAPAAMRYTEARLAAAATQMLSDIQKNTINFESNFDGTLSEPTVLPAAVPNLLVNGTTGIAVGMATSIPPHNLGEVVDALHYMLENWDKLEDLNVEDLMAFVQGPDFPTGGIIIHEEESDGLISAYSTGRGRVTVQASAHLEEMERGRNRIIINELPYMTNKSSLIERIASLVREERLEGIADLRDESDRQGMRIVIELTKTANPETVLRELYKSTPMQSTFSIIMLALVDGEPRVLSLKQALRVFIEHRLEIVRRRSEFDLEKARQRAHILEGLLVALHNLDEIIALIRKSPDAETARDRMIKRFKLTTIQAQAILDMQLRRLAALERKKIEEEAKEIQALIKELETLLRSPKKMRQVVDQELLTVKDAYADRRRTHIAQVKAGQSKVSMLTSADLKPDKLVWLSVSPDGLIARSLDESPQRLGGKDAPVFLAQASTRDTLYLVTEQGEAVAVPVHALPEVETPQAGLPLHKVSALKDGQTLAAMFTLPAKERGADAGEQGFVVTASRQGMLKKSAISELPGPSAGTFTMVKINPGDRLGWIRLTKGADELLLVSTEGMAIRFSEEEVRPMGLVAAGVMGIKLQDKDELAGMEVLPAAGDLFLLASDGSAKRIPFDHFSRQGRYGQGLIAWKLPAGTRIVGVVSGKGTTRIIIHLTRLVPKTIRLDDAPLMSRAARGQSIRDLKTDDPITRICIPWEIAKESIKGFSKTAAKAVEKTPAKTAPKSTVKIVEKSPTKPTSKITTSGAEKSATKPTGKATEKTPAKPAKKTAAKAVVKSSEKSPTKTAPKVANKPPAKPAPKPVTKVVGTTSSKPVPKPAAKTAGKAPAKSTPKPVAKAADKIPAKSTPKPAAKAADKAPAKPTPKPVAKASDKAPVKPTTKPAAKAADKTPAKSAPTTGTKAAGKTPITTTVKTTGQTAKKSTSQTKPKTTQPKVEKSPGKQVSKENAPSKPAPKTSATTTPKENDKPAPSQKPANKKSSTP